MNECTVYNLAHLNAVKAQIFSKLLINTNQARSKQYVAKMTPTIQLRLGTLSHQRNRNVLNLIEFLLIRKLISQKKKLDFLGLEKVKDFFVKFRGRIRQERLYKLRIGGYGQVSVEFFCYKKFILLLSILLKLSYLKYL